MSNPLRGRDSELGSLHKHLARLRSGSATNWLIEGRPGLGKTRFGAVAAGATVIAPSALSIAQASTQASAPARAGQGSDRGAAR